MQVARVWLDNLTADFQAYEPAPETVSHKFYFASPAGRFHVHITKGQLVQEKNSSDGSSSGDYYVGAFLYWGGAPTPVPAGVRYSMAIDAVKAEGRKAVLDALGVEVPQDKWAIGWGYPKSLTWAQLRAAVTDGGRLQLAIAVATGGGEAAGLDTTLRLPPPLGTAAPGGGMLGGPFCDVAVRAGGREFKAHRVVLAAASPALLRMFDGDMQEAAAAAVELQGADAAAVELLLQHIYGATIDAPLALLPALYGLADQYQLRTTLCQDMRLWLGAVDVQPAALAALAPAVHLRCQSVFKTT
ncbi:MAG: hypothetical protein J3K34DRAFT_219344 [Monoraphidium minutum]|nr:MAG: hypothetical protein J3K34DRAFT_219344 [Monoraphidium minutum]